jgi:hypothetical protein
VWASSKGMTVGTVVNEKKSKKMKRQGQKKKRSQTESSEQNAHKD